MKPRIKSKTLWTNSVLIGLALAILNLPEMSALVKTLPDTYQMVALIVFGAVNIVLREVTTSPLGGWVKTPQRESPAEDSGISGEVASPKAKNRDA